MKLQQRSIRGEQGYVEKALIISWLKQITTHPRLIYEYNQKLLFATVWITVLLPSAIEVLVSSLRNPNSSKVHQTRFPLDTAAFLRVKTAGPYSWTLTLKCVKVNNAHICSLRPNHT
jgi:hypothetical protein